MPVRQSRLIIRTRGQGPIEITERVAKALAESHLRQGTVSAFCRHTSCSLALMENADPTAWQDLQGWLERLVPEDDPHFRHTLEGSDDMPSHIKMVLTRSSETIPFSEGRLLLGTWQGLFLWEHRRAPHEREIVLTIFGE
ncbi:MAG TPA: secondary thiamine-phosphate synthase enzyme YjbQ [Candidatus Didemnitutus sp.]|nr:secondary thiamine-phosphate synthase enzyme YjbQ [Candidatus Didemnitutus sp.]